MVPRMRLPVFLTSAVVATVICGMTLASASTSPQPSNASSVRSMLRARYRYARTLRDNLADARGSTNAWVSDVARECSGALAEAPRGTQLTEIRREVNLAPLAVLDAPDRAAARQMARAIERLRWSDRALARAVRGWLTAVRAGYTLPVPNLCSDLKAWVASDYHTFSPGTVGFTRALRKLLFFEGGSGEPGLEQRLHRYEDRLTARFAHRLRSFSERVGLKYLKSWQAAAEALSNDLALPEEAPAAGSIHTTVPARP